MRHEFVDGRLQLHRTESEREPLLHRLRRIEGQIRGLRQMIEEDRYCGDEVQQANAAMAALREVLLLLVEQHLAACAEHAAAGGPEAGALILEMKDLLRRSLRHV